MAIFGKKKDDADELLKRLVGMMDEMSDEEYDAFVGRNSNLFGEIAEAADAAPEKTEETNTEDEDGKPDTSEEIEKAEEDIAEKGPDSQSVKDRVDESVAAQEEEHGQEDSQDAKDRVDEAEGEEKAEAASHDGEEEQAEQDVLKQLAARISALEETIAKLTDSHAAGDFGMQPVAPPQGDTSEQINEAVLRGYAGANAYKYR